MSGFTAASGDDSGSVTVGGRQKTLPAATAAEVVRAAGVVGTITCRIDRNGHPAYRIARLECGGRWWADRRVRGRSALHADDLRQNAEGELLRRARADIDPGGVPDGIERGRRCAARHECLPNLGEALAAGYDSQVRRLDPES